ncbi:MAG TPA: alpha/beta fold hydrolase [Saprospiraceae bacterium]|nr:alpha/beta fold hydrolase [Saprospiraceae bacterium]WKZ62007.1 MAG: alpha/beta fold hydrolase [Saprospiraceae bacterium]HMY85176.1 alpha/beta fold hydrolase [Saprospiraceae bacterium]HNA77032.1 alpha/beta fold hydrolase [Saprospiraceae bacterium]HNB91277.1 alpha/beta fold hydrolase [Saprospiraceae bacterium]
MSDRMRVTTFDLRNHGRSAHVPDFSIELMASDVYEMLQALHIGSAVIIGHSMGARVAMCFSLAYPAVTDGLIAVDMATKKYERGHDDIFAALEAVDLNAGSRKEVENILAKRIPDEGTLQFLMKNLSRREGGIGFEWKMNLPVIKANYETILQPIASEIVYQGPVLFIRGGNSNYVADEDLADIKKFFPYAELATVAGAGHWVHAERPDAILTLIEQFVAEL